METAGVPPGKVQFHAVGVFAVRSVKIMHDPAHIVVSLTEKAAIGKFGNGAQELLNFTR